MQFSSRSTIAVHILLCVEILGKNNKITSNFLAQSVNTNPVIIRNILGSLSSAGIVEVRPGVGGAVLARPADKITLLDIFKAVEREEALFRFHENPNMQCPIGRSIHSVMDAKLENVRSAMETEMSKITLSQLVKETKKNIKN